MTNLKKSVTMRQPDTSALRERLNNYTPGQELNEDKQELEGLLQEVSDQILAIRNLLKEINTVKEELEKVNQCSVSHIKAEEARRQRLEQRNDALADEFRRLKPEIAEAYRLLNKFIEGIGAYAGTMINLHDLLKTSFPIRLTKDDIQALLDEINAIADNAISCIRREREKADKDIRRNENRISMTQVTFWCMIALLLNLASFFAVIVFANVKLLHSGTLTGMIAIFSVLITATLVVVALIFYKYSH